MGPVGAWPQPGTENILAESELRVGGSAGNAALTLQALGAPFRLVCNVGDDIFGRWLREPFGAAGRGWPVSPVPTTVSVGITHANGERTFLTSQGHLAVTTLKDVVARLPRRAGRGDIALLLRRLPQPEAAGSYEALIDLLVARGFEIALDTGWPSDGWSETTIRRMAVWLTACDHLLLNEIESCAFSRQPDVETAARWLSRKAKPGAAIVIKQGPRGATAWRGGERFHAPAPEVTVIDTIGAGDAFNAGYLAAGWPGATSPRRWPRGWPSPRPQSRPRRGHTVWRGFKES